MISARLAILFSAISLAFLPILSTAGTTGSGFFVSGSAGSAHVDAFASPGDTYNELKGSQTAYDLNVGYRWNWFGVETGYVDPGNFRKTYSLPSPLPAYTDKGHARGVTAGVNVHYEFMPHWYVSGRAGAFRWHGNELIFSGFNDIGTEAPIMFNNRGSRTDWYAGAGVGYDVSEHFGIGVTYDRYKAAVRNHSVDLTNYIESVTAEYRF